MAERIRRIFANIYSYDGNVEIIGQRVDMYYKLCWLSTDPSCPGVFIEGGRNSNFNCNYWTVKGNTFVDEPLWHDGSVSGKMEYTELSDNKQLISEAEQVVVDYTTSLTMFDISEENIQMLRDGTL